MQQLPTTRKQHLTSNNFRSCWPTKLVRFHAAYVFCTTYVASVSVCLRSKERGTRLSFHFSRGQNRKSRSSVFLCSETKRKRLLRRLTRDFLVTCKAPKFTEALQGKWVWRDILIEFTGRFFSGYARSSSSISSSRIKVLRQFSFILLSTSPSVEIYVMTYLTIYQIFLSK